MTSLGISLHTLLDILNTDDFQYQVDPQGYIQVYSSIFKDLQINTKDVLKAIFKYLSISSDINDSLKDTMNDP